MSMGKLLLAAALTVSTTAWAHSPYLLPNTFDVTKRDHVTVQGSFTEAFFTPDVVMKSELYQVIQPDGKSLQLTPHYARDLALLEVATTAPGTYRITSGQREGRTAKAVLINGEWEFLEAGATAPAGTTAVDMRSLTRADVYVTRGKPTEAALAPSGKGLEFRAVTHPNSIFVGSPAQFEVLFDGKPLVNQAIAIYNDDQRYADQALFAELRSDAKGRFAVSAPKPGVYLAMTRHRVDAATPGQPALSYTYSITFEVTD
jgi:uncharacterized GH25 family protein